MPSGIEKRSAQLLVCLLLVDAAFVVGHILLDRGFHENFLFSISKDGGYPEYFQYLKEIVIALLFCTLAVKQSQLIFFTWSILFVYFFVDDAFQLHETMGRSLVQNFGLRSAWGLRAQDYGELYVSLIAGAIVFSLIGVAYLKSHDYSKKVSRLMLVFIFFLAVFGVLIDTFHRAFSVDMLVRVLLEDGGEMIVMSIILAYVFALVRKDRRTAISPEPG